MSDEEITSSDSASSLPDSGEGNSTYIPLKPIPNNRAVFTEDRSRAESFPFPVKPATLHHHNQEHSQWKNLHSNSATFAPPPSRKSKAKGVKQPVSRKLRSSTTNDKKREINSSLDKLKQVPVFYKCLYNLWPLQHAVSFQ